MDKLKIEVGCIYKTRDGRKAVVLFEAGSFKDRYEVWIEDQEETVLNYKNGFHFADKDKCNVDLIAKWEDPRLEIAVKALDKIAVVKDWEVRGGHHLYAYETLKQIKGNE